MMRNLPLHKDGLNAKRSADSHASLWYDKFFDQYIDNYKKAKSKLEKNQYSEGKMEWVQSNAYMVGDNKMLSSFSDRQNRLIAAQNGTVLIMSTDWHFVTGMGNNHPVENGFSWHFTLGVPYLTGAAVKGMVKAWCEVWLEMPEKILMQWFGSTARIGELIFFDAIPTKPVQLKADIMTPHYGKWYAEGNEIKDVNAEPEKVPADWHDPIPIPFLVVDKGGVFQFGISKRADSDLDLKKVSQALSDALQWIGAGAKTAVGYGRFFEDKKAVSEHKQHLRIQQKEANKAKEDADAVQRRSAMSSLEAELDVWLSLPKQQAEMTAHSWLGRMEQVDTNDACIIALAVKQFYESTGRWASGSKQHRQWVKKIKSILQ